MKILLVNGSPHEKGNTCLLLTEAARELQTLGAETELIWLGNQPIQDCIGCDGCKKRTNRCVFDYDIVNRLIEKAKKSDGFLFGTPVHFCHPAGQLLCALDRAFYAAPSVFFQKPGAAVVVARRSGTTAALEVLNSYFGKHGMPIISSSYWNTAHGRDPGEVLEDKEGLQTMRNLARNMAWAVRCTAAGKQAGADAPMMESGQRTSFIRP